MAAGSSPSDTRGIFINSGTAMSGRVTLHSVAMPPLMHAFADGEAVDDGAGLNRNLGHRPHLPTERRSASQCGRPLSRIRFAAASTS